MGKFKKFGEFIKNKKPKEIDAADGLAGEDYNGPLSTKPDQKPTKNKYDKPLPYKATGEEESAVWTAPDSAQKKGFAYDATPGMTPASSSLGKPIENKVKQRPKPKKLTSEQFISTTKDMNQTEFANYVLESHGTEITPVTDLFGNEFTPDPTQTIQYITSLMLANEVWMERFVREMKRRDGLETLMKEVMDHGESYDLMVDHFEEPEVGLDRVNKFARTMNDHHMKNFENLDFGDDDEGLGESVSPDLDTLFGKQGSDGKQKQGGGPGGSGPVPDHQGGVYGNDTQSNAYGAKNPEQHSPSVTGQAAGGVQNPQFPGGQPVMPPKKMKDGDSRPHLKKSIGHDFINEMAEFPHFKEHMKKRCLGNCSA